MRWLILASLVLGGDMPKATVIQTNFTAGEFSPKLYGRVDIAKYQNAAKLMRDVVPVEHGGVRRREGTRYVGEVKDSSKTVRLIPFIYSTEASYVLEFGHRYMRVFTNGAQVLSGGSPYEIATTITESMLSDLDYTQAEDTLIIFHGDVAPMRVRRFASNYWVFDNVPFSVIPFDEIGQPGSGNLNLSGTTGSITVTAGAVNFRDADVGRTISFQGGLATITGYTSSTQVSATVNNDFPSTFAATGTWRVDGTPQATCTPSVVGPVGAAVTLTLSVAGWRIDTLGVYYVRINGGLIELTSSSYTGNTQVDGKIVQVLTGTTGAPAGAWTLERELWDTTFGYPRTGTFHDQRLVCAGTASYPQTIWGSVIGEYFNFTIGTNDDDAFSFKIASGQGNAIQYLASSKALMAFTTGAEYTIEGGVEKPLTPTNVQIKVRSNRGCARVRPLRVDNEEFFVQRSGKKLMTFAWNANAYDWGVSDVALLSEHLMQYGIKQIEFHPDQSRVYAVMNNGFVAVCTFSREQDLTGWSLFPYTLVGGCRSIAVIPSADGDQVYMLIRRIVNGVYRQYMEIASPGQFLDCAISGENLAGATVWSVPHLEGLTVGVVADGAYAGEFTVTGGNVTLLSPAKNVTIGRLNTPTIVPFSPDLNAGMAQGNSVRVGEVSLRFLETTNCQINGDEIDFRQLGDSLLDQPVPSFTGLKRLEKLGWERGDSEMTITCKWPFDFHLLALIRKITVND